MEGPIWAPSADRIARANLTAFIERVRRKHPHLVTDFPSLYQWSVTHPEEFWPEVWEACGVVAEERRGGTPWDEVVVGLDRMAPPDPERGPRWFPGARLNFAENLLRYDDDLRSVRALVGRVRLARGESTDARRVLEAALDDFALSARRQGSVGGEWLPDASDAASSGVRNPSVVMGVTTRMRMVKTCLPLSDRRNPRSRQTLGGRDIVPSFARRL